MAINILTTPNYEQYVKTHRTVVVDFYAQWCGPCKMLSPIIEQLSEEYGSRHVDFAKVDIDLNKELAQALRIVSIPTVIIYRNGKIHSHFVGYRSKPKIKQMIDEAIKQDI
ncbi:MAG: thioredoxin [Malacoplasma sp.]|nr:thioredoxin [Malacoplasma sp.]